MTITTTRVPESGTELLREMAAIPAGPERAALRDEAIRTWLPLARHLAHRYTGRGEPDDDLLQIATLGLIKAIDRFDPSRGIEFVGFAIPTVLGEIRRHFRDRTWSVRVPRRMQELRLAITEASNALTQTLGRSPTVPDIAKHLNITEEEVLEGLEGARAYSARSLSIPVTEDGSTTLGDTLGETDHDMELAELRVALGPAMATLEERERTILSLRFFGNLTQSEIAERIGVSQMHISRLITRSLAKLRTQLNAG
ncbi:SigB/SigF/SigG family RNA polymerase sigma factor [Actinoplanes sp. N902-109]|uniref:SigB/SigF/SigG family RNA polymerase sigma factor n=1 Tax=Actinoplanes sp. (strain N902-109) TaxID=649831 RepID=UPI0003295910|nr:SigB/SigF/SigG family RNA polymerase sigma factor [Actinoplanes sp. N902-109]AGL18062.1 sig b/f/g subfamily RNA polymerase sigma-28 subunit [Actinoplanes sp. N902-109]